MKHISLFVLVLLAAVLMLPAETSAQGTTWTVEYYDNRFLSGTPVQQTTNSVSFDWGTGSPAPGISGDNFSARFSTRASFSNGGTYRFFARADDEVRVSVDFQVIIDTLDAPRVGELLTADIFLPPGEHQIQVDYRERSDEAYVFVTWENAAGNPTQPNFSPTTETTAERVNFGSWVVQYYSNSNLTSFPTAILTEPQITQNWGAGSPVASVTADNFSARWSSVATLEAGRYQITARADDGVRVFVDSNRVIDRWNGPVGEPIVVEQTLNAGEHTFVVEYKEESGNAYIEFELARLRQSDVAPIPGQPVTGRPTGATGTVDAYRLNVRQAPTTEAEIVVKIEDGETYPIIGRNRDDSWWQLDVNGTSGWVFGDFIVPVNTASVPVTSESTSEQQVTTTDFDLVATGTVRLRSRPTSRGAVLGLLPFGARADIIGRNSSGTWVQVNYNGNVGWVSANFVRLPVSIDALPLGVE